MIVMTVPYLQDLLYWLNENNLQIVDIITYLQLGSGLSLCVH